jgi:gliding motility-associated-like protein
MFKKNILILVFFCAFLTKNYAQIDTSFWFVAPDISQGLGDRPIYLYFNTYGQPATVKISQPANLSFTQITKVISANSIDSVDLTAFIAGIENNTANSVLTRGLYISSTQNISVMYSIRALQNREYFTLKGSKALGTDFYVPMQEFWNQSPATTPASFSSIDIIASQNNTTVLITPKTNITGHTANITYSIMLQQGQTYSCQDAVSSASTSLAGSIVSSNKPVAVTIQSSGLSESGCLSSIGDQITHSQYIGTDYIINKGTGITEKTFILATQNNTQLTIDDGAVTTVVLSFGQTYTYNSSQPITYIKCTKPVYVLHVSGYGCRLSGAQVPPFFCTGTNNSAFTRANSDSLALNVFTRTGFEGNFTLNGNATLIPASAFTVVPGSGGGIMSATIYFNTTTIPVGSHNLVTNNSDVFGLGILNGSSTRGSAYGYTSEFTAHPYINAGANATICANGNIALNATIGGGNVTGTWSTSGYGFFSSGFSALTNTYVPNQIDTTIKPVKLFLTPTGVCPVLRDTLLLTVQPAPIVNASVDQILCGNNSSVLLSGTIAGGASTGIWSSTGTGTFVPNNTTLNGTYKPSSADTASGIVKLILTSTGNGICALVRDSMKVTITKSPTVDVALATYSACVNNPTVSVSGTIGGSTTTGKWTTSGSGSFNPSNIQLSTDYIPSTADVFAGQVKLYLSSTNNGNCIQAKDSAIVYFTPSPSVNAGVDLYSCKNDSKTLLAGVITGPTNSGIWSGGAGTYNPSNSVLTPTYTPTASELATGFVNLTLTSTNNLNCNAVNDIVKITFVPKPFANFNFANSCLNSSTIFTDFSLPAIGSLNQWNWSFGDGGTSSSQNTIHTYTIAGTYTAQLVVRNTYGCYDTVRQTPTIYAKPNADFGINRICSGAFLNLVFSDSTTITAPETITTWFWDFGGPGQSNVKNPTQLFPGSGLYNISLIVTSNHFCKDTIVKQITLAPRPIAGFAYSLSSGVNVGTTVNFVDTSKYASDWSWTFGDGSPTNTNQNPNVIYYSNGVYIVKQIAYDSYGCSDTAKVVIKINNVTNEISTLIPNAISPNGDGKNDVWKLDFLNILYPNAEVDIYNRWGENLYHSVGYANPWDGTYKSEKLPVGTYYYVLNLNDASIPEPFKGGILLIR